MKKLLYSAFAHMVNGATDVSAAIPGIAGRGHLLLSAGMVLLFMALRTRILGAHAVKHDAGTRVALQG